MATDQYIELTRPDGGKVWLRRDAIVRFVRSGPYTNIGLVGGQTQDVSEPPKRLLDLLRWES